MAEMLDSGLVLASENKRYYDRFRDRIMFPIVNPRGQIVGFGGRLMATRPTDLNTLIPQKLDFFQKLRAL